MKINKISMAIIAAAAVLAVCPAAMAQSTNQAGGGGAGRGGRGMGGRTNQMTVESLDKTLTLTEAEKPKVKTALEEYNKAMADARQADQSERRAKYTAAQQDLDKKLKGILSDDQYKKYEATRPVRRGGRNGGGGGGGAGGGAGGAGGGGANQ